MSDDSPSAASTWTFLTHHARVLIEIARDPEVRLRDIAASIGITERTAQNIVRDLYEAGYLTRDRVGRRNRYSLNLDQQFRYRTEAGVPISLLTDIFTRRELPLQDDHAGEALAQYAGQAGRSDGGQMSGSG
ncbi:winged helix-turn-helix domain-containing protein [Nonomuraea sp. B12E4]|uniref:helix-turn-helix transcriptional regulator n=1 Tax=Nonomuraea sp. B12E4 TaxID=3153564 RepID=UPI00325DC821